MSLLYLKKNHLSLYRKYHQELNDFSLDTVETPNLPSTPMPANVQPNIGNQAQAVDQNTNLTSTEMALLSPEEQLIRQRLRTRNV